MFIIFSTIGCGKAFKQLSDVNLIYEKKQGFSKPKLIYVAKIQHQNIEITTLTLFPIRVKKCRSVLQHN